MIGAFTFSLPIVVSGAVAGEFSMRCRYDVSLGRPAQFAGQRLWGDPGDDAYVRRITDLQVKCTQYSPAGRALEDVWLTPPPDLLARAEVHLETLHDDICQEAAERHAYEADEHADMMRDVRAEQSREVEAGR